jgi:hypothetical protein
MSKAIPECYNKMEFLTDERLCEERHVVTDVMLDTKMTKKNDVGILLKDHEWDTMSECDYTGFSVRSQLTPSFFE